MTFSLPHLCKHFVSGISPAAQKETHGTELDATEPRRDARMRIVGVDPAIDIHTQNSDAREGAG